MARRSRQRRVVQRCRACPTLRLEGEAFRRGLCPACLELDRRKRRSERGARILAKAKDADTVDRDGQTFRVVRLPPKRRSGRKVR